MRSSKLVSALAVMLLTTSPATASALPSYFHPTFSVGRHLSNVFSLMVSVKGTGFEGVTRVAGSARYDVKELKENKVVFDSPYRYDGIRGAAADHSSYVLDLLTLNPVVNGAETPNTQASGLAFNPYLWGTPAMPLRRGTTWNVTIPRAWELGPKGTQRVTVIDVDPPDHVITLMRDGTADGIFGSDGRERKMDFDGRPQLITITNAGPTHWRGYTTFRDGIVLSDDLLGERDVWVQRQGRPKSLAHERFIMLLNAIPM